MFNILMRTCLPSCHRIFLIILIIPINIFHYSQLLQLTAAGFLNYSHYSPLIILIFLFILMFSIIPNNFRLFPIIFNYSNNSFSFQYSELILASKQFQLSLASKQFPSAQALAKHKRHAVTRLRPVLWVQQSQHCPPPCDDIHSIFASIHSIFDSEASQLPACLIAL